jgi:hypothetical protein
MTLNGKTHWTLDQAAEILGLTPPVLVLLAEHAGDNNLPATRYGDRLYFDPDDIQNWFRRCSEMVESQEIHAEPSADECDDSDVLQEKLGQ